MRWFSLPLAALLLVSPAAAQEKKLTDDQKVAWAKLRRQQGEQAFRVVAYFSKDKTWLAWSLTGSDFTFQFADEFGFPYRDKTLGSIRLTTLLAREDSWKRSVKQSRETIAELQAEAKEQVKKDGKVDDGTQFVLNMAIKQLKEKLAILKKASADVAAQRKKLNVLTGLEQATASARTFATRPRIKATAVVDFFSKERPFVVKWFYDGGKGVKEFAKPPTAELGKSIAAYFYRKQVEAGE